MEQAINWIMAIASLAGQAFVVYALVILIFFPAQAKRFYGFFLNSAVPLAFFVSLGATLGSLYYSEIAGLDPCHLCWLQRIFIYPQVVLLALAWFKREENQILDYGLALSGLGFLFALYHCYIYYSFRPSAFCSITSPCVEPYVVGFSYLSLPLLSLTAFLIIITLLLGRKIFIDRK